MTPEVSSAHSVPTGYCSQKLWGLIFLEMEPWAGGPGVGWGLLTPKISLPNFYPPCGCGINLFCISAPPASLDGCGFSNSVVGRLHSTGFLTVLSDGGSVF